MKFSVTALVLLIIGLLFSQEWLKYNSPAAYLENFSEQSVKEGFSLPTAKASLVPADFFGKWNFDNGSGSVAPDSSPRDNTGTLVNSPEWVPGKFGTGLQFNGTNSYVTTGVSTNAPSGAISAWVKPTATLNTGRNYNVFASRASGNSMTLGFASFSNFGPVGNKWTFSVRGGFGNTLTVESPIVASNEELQQWQHLVATWDIASGLSLYINGELKGSVQGTTGSIVNTSQSISDVISPFLGVIDNVRVLNRNISVDEVTELYTEIVDPSVVPPTPVTPPSADTTAPTISSVSVTSFTSTYATISWRTNEPANSQVSYGTAGTYATQTPVNASMDLLHTVILNDLTPGTAYSFKVSSQDAAGNTSQSSGTNFSTSAAVDTASLSTINPGTALYLGAYNSAPLPNCSMYSASIVSYSRFTYDSTRKAMLMFGGGHGAVPRTDVDVLDLTKPSLFWRSDYESTQLPDMTAANFDDLTKAWKSTGHPTSRHTYDMLTYAPNTNELILLQSHGQRPGCANTDVPTNPGGKIWHYSSQTKKWTVGDDILWAQPSMDDFASSEYDPISGKIIILGKSGLYVYDPITKKSTKSSGTIGNPELSIGMNLVYYPPNQKMYYILANGTVFELSLDRGDFSNSTLQRMTVTGTLPSKGIYTELGWAYDPDSQIIGGGITNGTFYSFNPITSIWKSQVMKTTSTVPIGDVAFHTLDYDPVHKVYIFLGAYQPAQTSLPDVTSLWAYKYDDGTSSVVPDPTPPAPSLPSSSAYRNGQPYLFQAINTPVYKSTLGGTDFNADKYGPTYKYVDAVTGWAWKNNGGDWLDAKLAAQGNTPWASFAANAVSGSTASHQYSGIDVTSLLQYCQEKNHWVSLLMKPAPGSAARNIGSVFLPGGAPSISVTYMDDSTAVLPARIVALNAPGSAYPQTALPSIGLPAFLEFDRPAKAVKSATLTVTVTAHWSGRATLNIFLLDPPLNTEGVTGGTGLASQAGKLDSGISGINGVLGAHRYVDGATDADFFADVKFPNIGDETWYDPALWGGQQDLTKFPHNVVGKWVTQSDIKPALVGSNYQGEGFEPLAPGLGALKAVIPKEAKSGVEGGYTGTLGTNASIFMPYEDIGLLDHIFVRYYMRLGTPHDRSPADMVEVLQSGSPKWADLGGKFGIAPNHATTYGGNSGSSGGGYGWQLRYSWQDAEVDTGGPLEGGVTAGWHLYDFLFKNPAGHNYGAEGQAVSNWGQKGGLGGVLYAGRWYGIETEVKLNTVNSQNNTYQADGLLRTWIDGRLVFERTGMVFRTTPVYDPGKKPNAVRPIRDLGVRNILWNWYNGGTTQSPVERTEFITGLVWAKERIGLMKFDGANNADPQIPAVVLTANPLTVAKDQSTTLAWSSTQATTCTTSWGASGLSGSYVTPALSQNTTYSVTCSGAGGSKTTSITVNVTVSNVGESTPTVSLTGPASGTVGVMSSDFTISVAGPIAGVISFTPSDGGKGGVFSPASVVINQANPTKTFSYRPTDQGVRSISVTNNRGLTNPPAQNFNAVPAAQPELPTPPTPPVTPPTPNHPVPPANPGSGLPGNIGVSNPRSVAVTTVEKSRKKKNKNSNESKSKKESTGANRNAADKVAPWITLKIPKVGTPVNEFSIRGRATDQNGIQKVVIAVNGVKKKTIRSSEFSYAFRRDTAKKTVAITLAVYDARGNVKVATIVVANNKIVSVQYRRK